MIGDGIIGGGCTKLCMGGDAGIGRNSMALGAGGVGGKIKFDEGMINLSHGFAVSSFWSLLRFACCCSIVSAALGSGAPPEIHPITSNVISKIDDDDLLISISGRGDDIVEDGVGRLEILPPIFRIIDSSFKDIPVASTPPPQKKKIGKLNNK